MPQNDVLVSITASRSKADIVYKVECSSEITNEEFEYYLGEIITAYANGKTISAKRTSEATEAS